MSRSRTRRSALRRGVLRRVRRGDDTGVALVMVVGSMVVLAMLAMIVLAYTVQSSGFARRTQDYTAAITAAQSGIEDVISQLNRDPDYGDQPDCSNLAMQRPMDTANPCGWNASTPVGWRPVDPSQTDPDAPHFHYEISSTLSEVTGTVTVTSSGRVNGVVRTVEAAVGKGGSTDYVYYTDYESADPANVHSYKPGQSNSKAEGGAKDAACGANGHEAAEYWWEGRHNDGCAEITFAPDDVLDGGVFTNDSAWSSTSYAGVGVSLLDGFLTANPACQSITSNQSTWRNCLRNDHGASSKANFNGIQPRYHEPYYLDDTSAEFATYPGCHYAGSTRIVFQSDGTMRVWNKTANNGGQAPVAIGGPLGTPSCGTLSALNSASGALLDVPDAMVVYVGPAPASVPRVQCNSGEIGGPGSRTLPIGTYNRSVHTASGGSNYDYDETMTETNKRCQEGNLYVEGVLNGRVSLAAAQSIIVTGDLVLAGGRNGDDVLGLVATNSVEVFHPRKITYTWVQRYPNCATSGYGWTPRTWQWCQSGSVSEVSGWPTRYADPTTGSTNPSSGLQIAGSIQTLQHSFFVQKYDVGGHKGTLNVFGSIAQRWRGAVGTSAGHGYDKLYQYDRRLIYGPPPYFPRWADAQYTLRYSGEIENPDHVRSP